MSNLHLDPEVFLEELFEFEDCDECGRGPEGHDAIPLLGNWFARCVGDLEDWREDR
jgi:hypothetical protein